MSKIPRNVMLAELPVKTAPGELKETERKIIEIEVSYGLGGLNYFTGGTNPRGYSVAVRPITLSSWAGGVSKSFMLFSGVKTHLLDAGRVSKGGMTKAVAIAKSAEFSEKLTGMVNHVLTKEGLELEEGARWDFYNEDYEAKKAA